MSIKKFPKNKYNLLKFNYSGMFLKKKILGDFYIFDVIRCYVPRTAKNKFCFSTLNVTQTVTKDVETKQKTAILDYLFPFFVIE